MTEVATRVEADDGDACGDQAVAHDSRQLRPAAVAGHEQREEILMHGLRRQDDQRQRIERRWHRSAALLPRATTQAHCTGGPRVHGAATARRCKGLNNGHVRYHRETMEPQVTLERSKKSWTATTRAEPRHGPSRGCGASCRSCCRAWRCSCTARVTSSAFRRCARRHSNSVLVAGGTRRDRARRRADVPV